MPNLENQLNVESCPHCGRMNPTITGSSKFATNDHNNSNNRHWQLYICRGCGGVIIAAARSQNGEIIEMYPKNNSLDEDIPERPREYLRQAINSIHAPAGAIMLAASSVDSMLKLKDYREGSLYNRIDQAKDNNLITDEMALWAHEVRLESNEQRHADEGVELPNIEDAQRVIDFTKALANFLFVLPARVNQGLQDARGEQG